MTCHNQGKYQVPWVSPPEFLPTLQQASSMRIFIYCQKPVSARNRRLGIPPDVNSRGKKKSSCLFLPGVRSSFTGSFCCPPALRLVNVLRSEAGVGSQCHDVRGEAVGFPSWRPLLQFGGSSGFSKGSLISESKMGLRGAKGAGLALARYLQRGVGRAQGVRRAVCEPGDPSSAFP